MIGLRFLSEHPVAVLGLGKTGLAASVALYESGVPVWAWDDTPEKVDEARARGIDIADLTTADLAGIEYLLLSPGIAHTHPAPHPVVTRARDAGLKIVSDIELLLRAQPQAKYIGITGTNGKSTTTALIGHILQACGVACQVGGNLGPAVLSFDPLGPNGVYVLELSSYQLELTPSLAPDVGVLLNITPDHLSRHGGMEGYVAAKRSLFRKGSRAQVAVVGIDDPYCRTIARAVETDRSWNVVTISTEGTEATITVSDGVLNSIRSGWVADLSDMPALPGKHNWQNAAAAFAACRAIGLEPKQIFAAMRSFPGLAHRQQRIAVVDGVAYVNDSKATNADAAGKALACYGNIYWIAGGQAKEGGLNGLEAFMPQIRHAFLIGKAQDAFAAWLDGRAAYSKCGTLDHAVRQAHDQATSEKLPGAVVLLSPACASWDQFRSFEHRGERFAELVHELPVENAA